MKRAVFRELVPWAIVSIMAAWHLAEKQGILTSQEAMNASDERPTGPGPDLCLRHEVFDRLLLQHEAAQQRLRLCAKQLEAMRAKAGSAPAEGGSSLPSHSLPVETLNRSSGGSLDVTAGALGHVNTSIDPPGAMPTPDSRFSRRCEAVAYIFVRLLPSLFLLIMITVIACPKMSARWVATQCFFECMPVLYF
jgi:hypothetical protein